MLCGPGHQFWHPPFSNTPIWRLRSTIFRPAEVDYLHSLKHCLIFTIQILLRELLSFFIFIIFLFSIAFVYQSWHLLQRRRHRATHWGGRHPPTWARHSSGLWVAGNPFGKSWKIHGNMERSSINIYKWWIFHWSDQDQYHNFIQCPQSTCALEVVPLTITWWWGHCGLLPTVYWTSYEESSIQTSTQHRPN